MAYSGDLLWVNHDPKNRKARPHRHQVFSHIQSGYHKWRRVEAARSMRKSVVTPRPHAAQGWKGQHSQGAHEHDRTRVEPEDAQQPPIQSIVAFRGNSDPFKSTPVHVTSRVNDILTFERRSVFPVIQGPGSRLQAQGKGDILPSWSSFATDSMCDDMTALAFLLAPLTLMAQSSSGSTYSKLSLVHRSKGLHAVQEYIRESGPPPLHVIMLHIVAEIWAENCDEALIHLGMAKAIMESEVRENPGEIVPYKWISVFQMDIHRATLSLSWTLFPMDGWVLVPFEVPLPIMDVYPDSCLQGTLRALFVELQQISALYELLAKDPSPRPAAWTFMRMRTLVLIGRAVNHAVGGRDISASLALAYVLKLVSALENILVGTTSIYNAGPQMLGRVKSCLDSVVLNPRLRLWVLYVGALSGDKWFTRSFDVQTAMMSIETWETCKDILSRFYLPKDEPHVHFHAIFDTRLSKRIRDLTNAFGDVKLNAG